MEKDLAEMNAIAGLEAETRAWIGSYLARKNKINELMWDEAKGAYCDYDFVRKCRSGYNFITAFYPMWAGIPDRSQAEKLARNLRIFEREGGLASSDSSVTGSSWDYPFGWAPVQVLVAQALAKYGYVNDAQRVAVKWCSTVLKEFLKYNFLFEKYYVENAGKTAYDAREGSCWTNASFLILLDMAGDRKNITAIK
jgi:alpha,alpha-trehalase